MARRSMRRSLSSARSCTLVRWQVVFDGKGLLERVLRELSLLMGVCSPCGAVSGDRSDSLSGLRGLAAAETSTGPREATVVGTLDMPGNLTSPCRLSNV